MNIVHLSGNFTRKPEVREVNSGGRSTKVANFVVASSRRFKKKDGTLDEETTFVNCEAWDSGGMAIYTHCAKGDLIDLAASARNNSWIDKKGDKRYATKFRVKEFKILSNKKETRSA